MSARAPFVPRPASRVDDPSTKPPPPSSSSTAYEAFRPTGLLGADTHIPNSEQAPDALKGPVGAPAPQAFKPLNVSGLAKAKHANQGPSNSRPMSKSRSSADGSAKAVRSPKPFSPVQHKHLSAPRPSSPFFPNSGLVSLNAFRAPAPPQSASGHASPQLDDFSSNKAHVSPAIGELRSGLNNDPRTNSTSDSNDTFRYLATHAHRARTASHPSLDSIREEDEEDDTGSPRKVQGSPPAVTQEHFSGDFPEDLSDLDHGNGQYSSGLRRASKRVERIEEEDDFGYGVEAKRYKMAHSQDEYPIPFSGRATPIQYSVREVDRAVTPAQIPSHGVGKNGPHNDSKQALYRLLGQDLDICVEAHADAYEQARKKWSECTAEDWTKGADELSVRFAALLDFVKDHMTTKLALYASLHNTISEHRATLTQRDKTLKDARESLVREGGAVVGGAPKTASDEKEV